MNILNNSIENGDQFANVKKLMSLLNMHSLSIFKTQNQKEA